MASEEYLKKKRRYIGEYQKKFYVNFNFKLRKGKDDDVIEKLKSQRNRSSYIVDLIRKHG